MRIPYDSVAYQQLTRAMSTQPETRRELEVANKVRRAQPTGMNKQEAMMHGNPGAARNRKVEIDLNEEDLDIMIEMIVEFADETGTNIQNLKAEIVRSIGRGVFSSINCL